MVCLASEPLAAGSVRVTRKRHAPPRCLVAARAATAPAPPVVEACEAPLACPVCQRRFRGALVSHSAHLQCATCRRSFPSREFADLVITSSGAGDYQDVRTPRSQSLFQSPLIAGVYERGWRASFAWAGFPGEAAEFEQAQAWLSSARGGVLLDASCGSGLFTRRFAATGTYARVVGLDFSEAMLREAKALATHVSVASPVTLVRADISRLPFPTASLDGAHAGAALHCWPSPLAAMAEISRCLKPGASFVASTFLDVSAPFGEVFGDSNVLPVVRALNIQRVNSYRWWSELELRSLMELVGLVGFERVRNRQYIMLRATKPPAPEEEEEEEGDKVVPATSEQ